MDKNILKLLDYTQLEVKESSTLIWGNVFQWENYFTTEQTGWLNYLSSSSKQFQMKTPKWNGNMDEFLFGHSHGGATELQCSTHQFPGTVPSGKSCSQREKNYQSWKLQYCMLATRSISFFSSNLCSYKHDALYIHVAHYLYVTWLHWSVMHFAVDGVNVVSCTVMPRLITPRVADSAASWRYGCSCCYRWVIALDADSLHPQTAFLSVVFIVYASHCVVSPVPPFTAQRHHHVTRGSWTKQCPLRLKSTLKA